MEGEWLALTETLERLESEPDPKAEKTPRRKHGA